MEISKKILPLLELSGAHIKAQCLVVGLELGVADYFEKEKPVDSKLFCEEIGIDQDYGFRLLRSLAALGVLEHHYDQHFSLTETGEYFQKDHEIPYRSIVLHRRSDESLQSYFSKNMVNLLEEGGEPLTSFELLFEKTTWEHLQSNEKRNSNFNEAMKGMTFLDTPVLENLLLQMDWKDIESVCDIGGGTGLFAQVMLDVVSSVEDGNEPMEVTIVDVPNVIHDDQNLIKGDQIDFQVGDMFDTSTIPSDQDLYSFKNVFLDWYDDDVELVLKNVYEAAKEGSMLMICENILPEIVTEENGLAVFLDIHMMTVVGGKERTLEEYKELFERTGWEFLDLIECENPARKSLVLGVK